MLPRTNMSHDTIFMEKWQQKWETQFLTYTFAFFEQIDKKKKQRQQNAPRTLYDIVYLSACLFFYHNCKIIHLHSLQVQTINQQYTHFQSHIMQQKISV